MQTNHRELLTLPLAEQMEIVEMIWENLDESASEIPLPSWLIEEGVRRREEMLNDPALGKDHATVWESIERRHG
jgi:Putative addiction module component